YRAATVDRAAARSRARRRRGGARCSRRCCARGRAGIRAGARVRGGYVRAGGARRGAATCGTGAVSAAPACSGRGEREDANAQSAFVKHANDVRTTTTDLGRRARWLRGLLTSELSILDAARLVGGGADSALQVGLVGLVISFEPHGLTVAFESEDVCGDAIEEPAIVADDDGAACEVVESVLE